MMIFVLHLQLFRSANSTFATTAPKTENEALYCQHLAPGKLVHSNFGDPCLHYHHYYIFNHEAILATT